LTQVICDTDFLIKITNDPLPSLGQLIKNSDLVLATIPGVVNELKGLTQNEKPATARRAAAALRLVGSSVHLIKSGIAKDDSFETDNALYDKVRGSIGDVCVATLDGKLLSRFERNKIPYLTLRRNKPFLRCFSRATHLSTTKD
jgi:rRNA-processing protein FCF1